MQKTPKIDSPAVTARVVSRILKKYYISADAEFALLRFG